MKDYKCHVSLCAFKSQPHGPICPVAGGDRKESALLDAPEGKTDSVICVELIVTEGFLLPAQPDKDSE